METTTEEKERLREIIRRLVNGDKQWLDATEIIAKDAGLNWILNYNISGKNDYNRLVRGVVVQKPQEGFSGDPLSLIKSFPFTRFFNQGEVQADAIDFKNAEMLEKMDGSMVGVFFPDGTPQSPQWHTRKMMSSHQPDYDHKVTSFHGGQYQFLSIIGKYVKAINFSQEDTAMTYVFEFIHDASFVWTKYTKEQHGLYLLGARNVSTHRELSEKELDQTSKRLNIPRPRRWDAIANHDEILALMKQIEKDTPGFEGFVFRDKKTGKRIKVKDPDYVKFHHMLDQLSYKNLVTKVLEGETEEIIAYFPSAKPKIENIIKKHKELLDKTMEKIDFWRSQKLDKKSLAIEIMGNKKESNHWIASAIMRNFQNHDDNEIRIKLEKELKDIVLGKQSSPRRFLDIIGITHVEEDSNQDA